MIAQVLESPDDHAKTAIGTPYYLSPEICQVSQIKNSRNIYLKRKSHIIKSQTFGV